MWNENCMITASWNVSLSQIAQPVFNQSLPQKEWAKAVPLAEASSTGFDSDQPPPNLQLPATKDNLENKATHAMPVDPRLDQ